MGYSDKVTWRSWSSLPAGTHTVTYQAIAATRGVFTLPPAHAYVDDQPELMGLSQAGTIVVMDDGLQKVPDPLDPTEVMNFLKKLDIEPCETIRPKSCPDGCPNGGVCQVATGTCACYQNFSFVDGDCPLSDTQFQQLALKEHPSASL